MTTYLDDDVIFYDEWHQHRLVGENALKTEERQVFLRSLLVDSTSPALVVGCGSAAEVTVFPKGVEVFAFDLSLEAVHRSRLTAPLQTYLVADAVAPPFKSSTFGTVVCSEVLEHVREPDRLLQKLHCMTRSGGRLVLTTPNWLSFYGLARVLGRLLAGRDFTSGDQPFDRWTTLDRLQRRLECNGFTLTQQWGFWFFPPFGKGRKRLPDCLVVPLLRMLLPLERLLRARLTKVGHVIVVEAKKDALLDSHDAAQCVDEVRYGLSE